MNDKLHSYENREYPYIMVNRSQVMNTAAQNVVFNNVVLLANHELRPQAVEVEPQPEPDTTEAPIAENNVVEFPRQIETTEPDNDLNLTDIQTQVSEAIQNQQEAA